MQDTTLIAALAENSNFSVHPSAGLILGTVVGLLSFVLIALVVIKLLRS